MTLQPNASRSATLSSGGAYIVTEWPSAWSASTKSLRKFQIFQAVFTVITTCIELLHRAIRVCSGWCALRPSVSLGMRQAGFCALPSLKQYFVKRQKQGKSDQALRLDRNRQMIPRFRSKGRIGSGPNSLSESLGDVDMGVTGFGALYARSPAASPRPRGVCHGFEMASFLPKQLQEFCFARYQLAIDFAPQSRFPR